MRTASVSRTALICVALMGAAGGLAWLISFLFFSSPPPTEVTPKNYPLLPISSSPYLNVTDKATYVGNEVCSTCHERQTETWHQTTHSLAYNDVNLQQEPKGSTFSHPPSGLDYEVYVRNGKMHHREFLRDKSGKVIAEDDRVIRYLIGSGKHARTYLLEAGDFLAESPLTWYSSRKAWGMSPGYDNPIHWGFTRPVGTGCLTCHTGRTEPKQQVFRDITIREQAISCERCHGPGSLHVDRHRQHPRWSGDQDLTIVQPQDLQRQHLESICGDCHLQAEAPIYLRGRAQSDFRPGLPLKDFRIDYQYRHQTDRMTVVGHFEQMHLSKCYQNEKFTCTTCHDLHRSPPEDKVTWYRRKCLNCHDASHCGVEEKKRLAESPRDNCLQCHMPKSDTDIPHIAFTHHRVGIHSKASGAPVGKGSTLVPLQDVSHLPEIDRKRALGLAYLHVSRNRGLKPEAVAEMRRQANELLASVYNQGLHDSETLGALAQIFYEHDREQGVRLAQRALQDKSLSIDTQGPLRTIIADSHLRAGQYSLAIPMLQQLVEQRRNHEDWVLLGLCYHLTQKQDKALAALETARKINPFQPVIYEYLARVHTGLGASERAKAMRETAQALKAHPSPRTKLSK